MGKVEGDALTTENLIARIIATNAAINPHTLQTAALYLESEIKKAFAQGHKVDVLGLGVLRLGLETTVKNVHGTTGTLPHLEARFTVSESVRHLAKKLRIGEMYVADNKPRIFDICGYDGQSLRVEADAESGVEGLSTEPGANHDLGEYTRRYPIQVDIVAVMESRDDKVAVTSRLEHVTLKGQYIKIAGDGSGVFFAPMQSDGDLADEGEWLSISSGSRVTENTPSMVSFYVPKSIADGHYRIVLRTRYNRSGIPMKKCVDAVSCEVIVRGEFSLGD